MSTGHNDKEYLNRLSRRAEKHGLHIIQKEVHDIDDPEYGMYELRHIQTGAVAHQPGATGSRDTGLGLREIEDYLDGIS